MDKRDMLPVGGWKNVTAKERNKKAKRLLGLSIVSYLLAYLYLFACYLSKAPENVAGYGFEILALIGAISAFEYGRLPRPGISLEEMEELEKMLNEMK